MPSKKLKAFAFAMGISLVAVACGDDNSDTTPAATTPAATTPAAATKDIVDTAVAAGKFTVLAEALTKADLVTTLKGAGPFTVFAPTDEAFAAALKSLNVTKDQLFADKAKLASILTYHVVAGKVPASEVVKLDGKEAKTVNGAAVKITLKGSDVYLNGDTKVAQADVAASNGVIHVIDKVLLPPTAASATATPAATKDIVDTAVAAGKFTVLAEALTKADLVTTLKGAGPFTVFAPTDEAFAAALKSLNVTKDQLFADKAKLASILTYHVVAGKVPASEVVKLDGKEAKTVNGAAVKITLKGSDVYLNGDTKVAQADVAASNGVIHVIDKVLLPPAM